MSLGGGSGLPGMTGIFAGIERDLDIDRDAPDYDVFR